MPTNIIFRSCIFLVAITLPGCRDEPAMDAQDAAFERLAEARVEYGQRVRSRLESLGELATEAGRDEVLRHAFAAMRQDGSGEAPSAPDPQLVALLEERYVLEYGDFYDILFVDEGGFVFHTVKMESDYGRNLFRGPQAGTRLAAALREDPVARFIDYEIYPPSGEVAAFFVVPAGEPDELQGWIILQLAVNTLNSILREGRLGATGEVYVTTDQGLMITRSRFVPTDQALRISVDTEAYRVALEDSAGELVSEDYRGETVLSSVGTLDMRGSTWVIFAEMDQNEVVTRRYVAEEGRYFSGLLETTGSGRGVAPSPPDGIDPTTRVDINEFGRGRGGATVTTFGLSTCTGVVITLPGAFTYLGHVPPTDGAYEGRGGGPLLDFQEALTGVEAGDLVGEMLERIRRYEIYPHQLRDLRVTLVAVQDEGLRHTVRRLLTEGFFLSQITIVRDPTRRYANIYSSVRDGSTVVEWVGGARPQVEWTVPDTSESLGRRMSRLMN